MPSRSIASTFADIAPSSLSVVCRKYDSTEAGQIEKRQPFRRDLPTSTRVPAKLTATFPRLFSRYQHRTESEELIMTVKARSILFLLIPVFVLLIAIEGIAQGVQAPNTQEITGNVDAFTMTTITVNTQVIDIAQ